jgi:serine/threonine protein kinase
MTELCKGDLLKELRKRGWFEEIYMKEVVYGVYKGLKELGRRRIIHRDLKVANVFLARSGIPKIADFGFDVKCSSNFRDLNIGSPLYMSPKGLLHNLYDPKLMYDLWVSYSTNCFTAKLR